MTENEKAVLAVNEAFYNAFARNDPAAMAELWSNESDIAVIHPGWAPLHGREAVMDSWRRILSNSGSSVMQCRDARVYMYDRTAFVVCIESFRETELAATNVYVLEADAWKMVHHQAGPRAQSGRSVPADSLH